jgi:trehalose/maltose hydrolase-like predicted phosphorylase
MAIEYVNAFEKQKNWVITEKGFDPLFAGKIESLFCLQNGYMGVRAATEERLAKETRGCYVAGVFDSFAGEVTELGNVPDWLAFDITCAGDQFSVASGVVRSFVRSLDMRQGIVHREVEWEGGEGRRTRLTFERLVSVVDLHEAALRVTVEPLNYAGEIVIRSGLNGQVTNSGVQHYREGEMRLFPGARMAFTTETQESAIAISVAATHVFSVNGAPRTAREKVETSRRQISLASRHDVRKGETLEIVKHVAICTARDPDAPAEGASVTERAIAELERGVAKGYERLRREHVERWAGIWETMDVSIDGPDFDQLALRFAQFHIYQMTPLHDARLSIAAKGLSGEGYKGHVFWDTEIFILPLFTFTLPEVARRLLSYRLHTLEGARRKAKENGFPGAMFAWESAATGDEVTPKMGMVDILTGAPIRILSGDIEQHISADVVFAIWQYLQVTGDESFLFEAGLEILIETARFWTARATFVPEKDRYEILDVMGPDEYGEHVDNNAYTNTMVAWQLERTADYLAYVREKHPAVEKRLAARLGVSRSECDRWREVSRRLFKNFDESSGLINQYDGFTAKKRIDLSPYVGKVGSIMRDYGWEEIKGMQVIKQADTVMLLYLLGDRFSSTLKHANWDYYEPRTLHDSSLSAAIHAIVAADMGDLAKAYRYYQRAARVDLGEDPHGSTEGLHAASLGGLWQAAVLGFGGVRASEGASLRIDPHLPPEWRGLKYRICHRGTNLRVEVGAGEVRVTPLSAPKEPFTVAICGKPMVVSGTATIVVKA